jgi:anti-sigma-K factor RskA
VTPTPTRARLVELLATEATQKLSPAERNELAALIRAFPDEDPNALDLAAAAVHLALTESVEEMPAALAEKLYLASAAMTPMPPVTRPRPAAKPQAKPKERAERRRPPAWVAWSGWAVAASFGAVAMFALARGPKVEVQYVEKIVPGPTVFVKLPPEIIEISKEPTLEVVRDRIQKDPKVKEFAGTKGDISTRVVWSGAKQDGVLEVSGLTVNNPSTEQYQLWVIDKSRSPDPKPISVGVFDAKSGVPTLVRVNVPLRLDDIAAFAISKEPPGGLLQPTPDKILLLIPAKKG